MSQKPASPAKPATLRRRAEAQLKAHPPSPKPVADPQQVQHDLEVHQVELEMQNHELRATQAKLEAALTRHTEFYDFAPVGFLSLQPDGTITHANRTASHLLGVPAARLLQRHFSLFVHTAHRHAFAALLARTFASETAETAELPLRATDQPPQMFLLQACRSADGLECRLVLTDITEQRQSEAALWESKLRWEYALEGAGDGLWDWDVPANTVFFSKHWKEMLGFAEAEIGSALAEWIALIHPTDRPRRMADLQAHLAGQIGNYVSEHRLRCKDGSWKWILDRGLVIRRSPDGKPQRMIGTHCDITERKQAEDQLRERLKELRAFYGLAELNAQPELTLAEMYQGLANLLPASWQYPEIACARVQMGELAFCTSNFKASAWMLSEPVKVNGALVGRIEVGYLEARPEADAGPFLQEEQRLLTALAKQIGSITARKQAEAGLRDSDDRMKFLLRNTPVVIFSLSATDRMATTFISQNVEKALGHAPAAFLATGDFWGAHVHPEDLAVAQAGLDTLPATGTLVREYRFRHADGSYRWMRDDMQLIRDDQGQAQTIVGSWQDITQRKQLEQAMQATERRFTVMADAAPVLIWEADPDKLCTYFNKLWLDFTGRTLAQELGHGWAEGVHPDDLPRCLEIYGSSFDARRDFQMEYRLRRQDGEYRWLLDHGVPRYETDGRFAGYIGSCLDITAQKQTEQALGDQRESLTTLTLTLEAQRKFLSDLIENSNLVIYVKDREGRHQLVNRAFEELSQRKRENIIGLTAPEIFPGTDGEPFRPNDLAVLASGTLQTFEETLTSPDGKTQTFLSTKFPVRDAAGAITGLCGMSLDITERQQAEDQARQLAAIVASSNDAIIGKDLQGVIQSWNRGAETLLGYQASEMLGVSIRKLLPADCRDEEPSILRSYETQWQAKDGHLINVSITISPIKDSAGNRIGFSTVARDISAYKQAEAALRQNQALLLSLTESTPDAIYAKDTQGRYLLLNAAAQKFVGKSAADVLGQDDTAVFPLEEAQHLMKDDRRAMTSDIQTIDEFLTSADGTVRAVMATKGPLRDAQGNVVGIFGISRDITERKQLEEAHARLATAVEQAGESIQVADLKGTILYVNPAFEKACGYTSAEVLGQNSRLLKSGKQDAEFYRQMWGCLGRGETWKGHFTNRRKDGTLYEEDTTIAPIRDGEGRIVNYVAIKHDVTHELQLEAQVRQAQKQEAIGQLASGIAHDFNNILAAILGNVQMAASDTAPDHPARECLDEIQKASDRARSLVQQILTFSRQQPQNRQIIALGPILAEAARFLRATIPSGVEIIPTIGPGVPLVLADATQIHQVILNLGTNAWHALEDQPGRIGIQLQAVTLDAAAAALVAGLRPGRFACLTVSDTGKGMDAPTRARIFDPFFTTKEVGKGTGLGLSVVRGIVENHDGAITVVSEPGQGATFQVYFPAASIATAAAETAPAEPAPLGQGKHILFLDDEEALVRLGKRLLQRLGYRVTGFTQAAEAVQAFRAAPGQFDVVITDLNLPGISGLDVAQEFLTLRPDVPVLLCSGYITEPVKEQARRIGICHFLYKPNNIEELSKTLHQVLTEPR